jgi:hypothetical protein
VVVASSLIILSPELILYSLWASSIQRTSRSLQPLQDTLNVIPSLQVCQFSLST